MNPGHYTQSPIWLSQHEGIASPSSTAVNEDSVEESDEEEDDGDDDLDGYEDEEDEKSDADEAESMSGDEPTVPHWQIWGALLDWADPVAPATGYGNQNPLFIFFPSLIATSPRACRGKIRRRSNCVPIISEDVGEREQLSTVHPEAVGRAKG